MEKTNKTLNLFIIANIIILVASYLFCFQNPEMDVPGICEECGVMRQWPFVFGMIILLGQLALSIVLCVMLFISKGKVKYIIINVMASLSIGLALLQILIFGWGPFLITHGEASAETLAMINQYHLQFNVERIVNAVLIIMYIIGIVYGNKALRLLKKEQQDAEREYIDAMKQEWLKSEHPFKQSSHL